MRMPLLILTSAFLLYSCAGTAKMLRPEGETATLTLRNLAAYRVEILAISDSTIYVRNGDKISATRFPDVEKVYIHGYRTDPALRIMAAIPPLVIEGIVMSVAFDVGQPGWGVVSALTMAGTAYAFSRGDPKAKFSAPFRESELESMKLHCRYPQGLSDHQWNILLQHFGQEDFKNLSIK